MNLMMSTVDDDPSLDSLGHPGLAEGGRWQLARLDPYRRALDVPEDGASQSKSILLQWLAGQIRDEDVARSKHSRGFGGSAGLGWAPLRLACTRWVARPGCLTVRCLNHHRPMRNAPPAPPGRRTAAVAPARVHGVLQPQRTQRRDERVKPLQQLYSAAAHVYTLRGGIRSSKTPSFSGRTVSR
jgi:hypothetical protein